MFWLEAEDFNVPGHAFMRSQAKKIAKKYIAENSLQRVRGPNRVGRR